MNLSRFVKHSSIKLLQKGRISYLFDSELLGEFSENLFDISHWQQQQAILGSATGRGTTWFVQHPKVQMVLRHYYRGGLVGKFIHDSYFFTGLENTRAVQEFVLLHTLTELGLPAPKPIAVKVTRNILTYNADISSELISDAKDLVGILANQTLDESLWPEIGRTIRRFHNQNIYHHDLNTHNIMIDKDNKIWLIDFDQGKKMSESGQWKQQNMQRLLRSFEKEKNKLPEFNWQSKHWQLLMQGYQE